MVWTGCIYVLLDNLLDYTLNYYWHIDRIVLIWNMSGSSHKRTDSYRSNNSTTNGETNHQEKRAQWSTQAFTVEEIMQQFNLPQIVKCNQQAILVKRDLPLPINLTQPILLYDKKTIRKLLARNVVYDNAAHHYAENDETIVIPADYEGNYSNRLVNFVACTHKKPFDMVQTGKCGIAKIRANWNLSNFGYMHVTRNFFVVTSYSL